MWIQRAVFMRRAVIIAKRDQRANHKAEGRAASLCLRFENIVLNNGRVLPLHHEHRLLQAYALNFICEPRKRIKTESSLILEALRMNSSRVLIRRQFVSLAINN